MGSEMCIRDRSLIDKDPTLNLHNDLKKVLKNASTADINLG